MRLKWVLGVVAAIPFLICSASANSEEVCADRFCASAIGNGKNLIIDLNHRENTVAEDPGWESPSLPPVDVPPVSAGRRAPKVERFPSGDNLSCAYFRPGGEEVRKCYPDPHAQEIEDTGVSLSPEEVLQSALGQVEVEGAGLVINPSRRVFTGLPLLVYASTPKIRTSVELLGMTVQVELIAREFEYDFHNGQPPLITTDAGRPYPDKSLYQVYDSPQEGAFVSLRTTWSAQVWHPVTGESMIVSGAVVTTEESERFNVTKPKARLVLPGTQPEH